MIEIIYGFVGGFFLTLGLRFIIFGAKSQIKGGLV